MEGGGVSRQEASEKNLPRFFSTKLAVFQYFVSNPPTRKARKLENKEKKGAENSILHFESSKKWNNLPTSFTGFLKIMMNSPKTQNNLFFFFFLIDEEKSRQYNQLSTFNCVLVQLYFCIFGSLWCLIDQEESRRCYQFSALLSGTASATQATMLESKRFRIIWFRCEIIDENYPNYMWWEYDSPRFTCSHAFDQRFRPEILANISPQDSLTNLISYIIHKLIKWLGCKYLQLFDCCLSKMDQYWNFREPGKCCLAPSFLK